MAALETVNFITFGATSEKDFIKMTLPFQWLWWRWRWWYWYVASWHDKIYIGSQRTRPKDIGPLQWRDNEHGGVSIVYSNVCSGADQRKHQRSASLAFVRGIHRSPVNSPHKGPVRRKICLILWRHHAKTHMISCKQSAVGPIKYTLWWHHILNSSKIMTVQKKCFLNCLCCIHFFHSSGNKPLPGSKSIMFHDHQSPMCELIGPWKILS